MFPFITPKVNALMGYLPTVFTCIRRFAGRPCVYTSFVITHVDTDSCKTDSFKSSYEWEITDVVLRLYWESA